MAPLLDCSLPSPVLLLSFLTAHCSLFIAHYTLPITHYITLLRPSNFIITVASVFVSCVLAGGRIEQTSVMILASLAAGLIGGGGMVINDIFDVEIDRINKPQRPLPSGAVSAASAALFYAVLSAVGLLLNLFLHSSAQAIATGAVVLIFFYSYRLKSTPLFGNLMVGLDRKSVV